MENGGHLAKYQCHDCLGLDLAYQYQSFPFLHSSKLFSEEKTLKLSLSLVCDVWVVGLDESKMAEMFSR